ncbi:MAG TPA: thioredoxin family protein [Pirellulales bacterium]|nr:thioredoxin family protein [Pirellulales bacterium]
MRVLSSLLTCALLACAALGLQVDPADAAPPDIKWIPRIDLGQRMAVDEQKDLLIVFTGHGWCHFCTLLEDEVFKRPEFAAARDNFVLVKLNFLAGDLEQLPAEMQELQDRYAKWKEQYLISGVPVVVLADATGRPFAYTGYHKGITPASFLAHARKAQQARRQRDQLFDEARQADSDGARAQKLHEALASVAPLLSTLDERKDDPLFVFYGDVVEEIRRLDANGTAGVRKIYDDRIAALPQWRKLNEIWAQMDEDKLAKDYKRAIARLDAALPAVTDAKERLRLEWARQVFLEWDGQYEKALANARRMLADPQIDSQQRQNYLGREAYNLVNAGTLDEYSNQWARRYADAGDDAERLKLLSERANYFHGTPDVGRSISAWQEFRNAAEPNSEPWQTATLFLGQESARAGDHARAIALLTELWELFQKGDVPGTHVLLRIVEAQQAAGDREAARASLAKAEISLAAEAKQLDDPRVLDHLKSRLAKLREQAGE